GLVLSVACPPAQAVRHLVDGNRPVENPGWPLGAEKVANLPSRLGGWERDGEWHFLYRCKDNAEFSEALALFAAIRTPRLELYVHDGLGPARFGKKGKGELGADWTFTVWRPESWHRLYNNPERSYDFGNLNFRTPVAPPRIDVYLGGGAIVWQGGRVPEKIRVIDRRAQAAPIELVGGGLIRGDVYDMATGQAMAGAEITLLKSKDRREWEEVRRLQADALGSFEIAKIPYGGFYMATIRAKGYASRGRSYDLDENEPFEESIIELVREAGLRGIVTDAAGKPLPGVGVSAFTLLGIDGQRYHCPDAQTLTTSAEGRFEFRSLPKGHAQIRTNAPSMQQATSIFALYPVPSKDIRIVMTGTAIVRGSVVEKNGDPPADIAHIHLEAAGPVRIGKWGGSMECSPDGRFEFKGVPPGEYILSAKPILPGQPPDPNAKTITIKAGDTVDIQLER
ncbi:MAG: carboxypeptidase regulatory-like domain-containing protein, partial [Planctomycetes bacterium]|nr:carboxypeptidase regulatory-like domain-containing protein [Planctomycetota bacterium]